MTFKTCTKCGQKKAARDENFQRNKTNGDGWRSICKPCMGIFPVVKQPSHLLKERELREQIERLKQERDDAIEALAGARQVEYFLKAANEARTRVKGIERREKTSGLREGCALVCASDWHLEERVLPRQVNGRNKYDLDISRDRASRFFEGTLRSLENQRQWYKLRQMVLWLGGDFITNQLHPDNVETNLLGPVDAFAYAHKVLRTGIDRLLEDKELDQITIVCNDGNHGRLTPKQRVAARRQQSFEWLLYSQLREKFEGEKRLRWQIFEGEHEYLDIYGRTVRFTHGDSVNYNGGVGGVTIPILRAMGRWNTVVQADLTVMGHFHQRISMPDLIINGSLIGYSPYSMRIGARFEMPAQEFTVLDSRRFKSVSLPLWVSSPKDDRLSGES